MKITRPTTNRMPPRAPVPIRSHQVADPRSPRILSSSVSQPTPRPGSAPPSVPAAVGFFGVMGGVRVVAVTVTVALRAPFLMDVTRFRISTAPGLQATPLPSGPDAPVLLIMACSKAFGPAAWVSTCVAKAVPVIPPFRPLAAYSAATVRFGYEPRPDPPPDPRPLLSGLLAPAVPDQVRGVFSEAIH